jgi:hypothetical protein
VEGDVDVEPIGRAEGDGGGRQAEQEGRRTGGAGGEADRRSSRGWRRRLVRQQ